MTAAPVALYDHNGARFQDLAIAIPRDADVVHDLGRFEVKRAGDRHIEGLF
jgi:hypothetical protein